MEPYKNLIPTHVSLEENQKPLLSYGDLERDITLDQFIKHFTNALNYGWEWGDAGEREMKDYLRESLLSFCSDPKKIRQTQEMMYIMMHEVHLMDFILTGSKEFEAPYALRSFELMLIQYLKKFILKLNERFLQLHGDSRKILKPLISHCDELIKGEIMKNIQDFLFWFDRPMEFSCYLAIHPKIDDPKRILEIYRTYPDDSDKKKDVLNYNIEWYEPVCKVQDGENFVFATEKDYLQKDWETLPPQLTFIPAHVLMKLLGVHFEELFEKVIPGVHEPLHANITFVRKKGGYEMTLILNEVDDSIVLGLKDDRKTPKKLFLRERKDGDELKGPRNDLQKKLIGVRKSIFIEAQDPDYSSVVYKAKIKYFRSFVIKCQNVARQFGNYLTELRYLAFVAEEFRLINYGRKIAVFPRIASIEDNKTEILDALNPTLFLESIFGQSREIVPNSIIVNEKKMVQIITGPNQNGKSRYVDSIGINQIIFQAGWPIFAKGKACMSPKTDLRVHYVHSGVGITGESRFSHECQRMASVFTEMKGAYPLLLIDEPYTGTNYGDAEVLLKEILQACSDCGISIFLTTHFHGLIKFVENLPNGVNLHCAVLETGEFTYQIKAGSSTKSNALEVAKKVGARFEQISEIIKKKKSEHVVVEFIPEEEKEEQKPEKIVKAEQMKLL